MDWEYSAKKHQSDCVRGGLLVSGMGDGTGCAEEVELEKVIVGAWC